MSMDAVFVSDVELLLEMTQNAHALQEENEELKVRLETLRSRIGSVWDDVSAIREELEVRIARLELKSRGITSASSDEIMSTRSAECAPFEDAWADIRARLQALEQQAQLPRKGGGVGELADEMELNWVRSALQKRIAAFKEGRGQLTVAEDESPDSPPPPVPERPPSWDTATTTEEAPAKAQHAVEAPARALAFEDTTRALHLTVNSFQFSSVGDGLVACVFLLDGRRREQILQKGNRRHSTAPPQPVAFQRWSPNSSVSLEVYANGKLFASSQLLSVRNLIAQRETKVDARANSGIPHTKQFFSHLLFRFCWAVGKLL